jgi:hypothetical protein
VLHAAAHFVSKLAVQEQGEASPVNIMQHTQLRCTAQHAATSRRRPLGFSHHGLSASRRARCKLRWAGRCSSLRTLTHATPGQPERPAEVAGSGEQPGQPLARPEHESTPFQVGRCHGSQPDLAGFFSGLQTPPLLTHLLPRRLLLSAADAAALRPLAWLCPSGHLTIVSSKCCRPLASLPASRCPLATLPAAASTATGDGQGRGRQHPPPCLPLPLAMPAQGPSRRLAHRAALRGPPSCQYPLRRTLECRASWTSQQLLRGRAVRRSMRQSSGRSTSRR